VLNPVVIPARSAGTRCAVLRGSLCVYVCIVLIYSAAKLQVCFNKLTLTAETQENDDQNGKCKFNDLRHNKGKDEVGSSGRYLVPELIS